jgi:hypothetical protein
MLSKSKITRGLQCHKAMWLYKHRRDLISISPAQQAVFDTGTQVGRLAQDLFPGGTDATAGYDWPNYQTAAITQQLIQGGANVIYEATFISSNTLVAVDILVKNETGSWDAYEVKSSTSVKDPHIPDAAVQYFVLKNSGLDMNSISIVHINNNYVREGEVDVHQLFKMVDITEDVQAWQDQLPSLIQQLDAIEQLSETPDIEIGPHCDKPYSCLFKDYCWKHIPNYSVFDLPRGGHKAWELYEKGILEIKDIPIEYPMSDAHSIIRWSEITGEQHINQEALNNFLANIQYPIYHLDFETFRSAVPVLDNTKPFQQIPFQYSLHIEKENGELEHRAFLQQTGADEVSSDPREALIKQMLEDIGKQGTILVYNQSFEIGRIKELARDFPAYQDDLLALLDRIVDLIVPFSKKYYYTKEMQGSASIKYVLPALVPELSYDSLTIKNGDMASNTFLQMHQGIYQGDYQQAHQDLWEYCKLDTLAMVKLLQKLKEV